MVFSENSRKAYLKVTGLDTLFWLLVTAQDRYITETDKGQNEAQTTDAQNEGIQDPFVHFHTITITSERKK